VLRDRSTLSREADDGRIENVYQAAHLEYRRCSTSLFDQRQRHRWHRNGRRTNGRSAGRFVDDGCAVSARRARTWAKRDRPRSSSIVTAENDDQIAVREKTSFYLP
jgi:hypothetical protein